MDARSYAGLLKHLSLKAGVEHRTGRVADVSQDGHRISSIVLDGGETFEGDLYIDASGLESILAARNGGEFEGWERWLPSDRILSASGPQLRPVPAFAQVTAFKGGWIGLHPLQDRTAIVGAISADAAAELRDDLSVIAGIPIEGDALLSDFRPGMRPRPWTGNCVAIGQAAVSLEPLGSMQLHIAHAGISHLISLFPAGDGGFPPAAQYNHAVGGHARSLRDFQIAHYRLNKRFDEPLWDRARDAEGPETLTSRLDAFRERGDIPFFEGDTFTGSDWSSILVGHGLEPAGSDPRIEALREQELMAMIQARLQKVAADVRAMPPIEEFIQAAGSRSQPGV
jgi:tryptophan halogenase